MKTTQTTLNTIHIKLKFKVQQAQCQLQALHTMQELIAGLLLKALVHTTCTRVKDNSHAVCVLATILLVHIFANSAAHLAFFADPIDSTGSLY